MSETSTRTLLERLGPTGPLALVALFMPALAGIVLLTNLEFVSEWLKSHAGVGIIIYSLAFAVLAGLAFLPTYAQAILGGYAFGLWVGTPAALVGFVGGAWIGYEIARVASRDRVEQIINERPKWRAVRDALLGDSGAGFWKPAFMVALIRCPPNSPFAITNLVLASVKIRRAPYVLGTLVGMTPRTVLAVVVGAGINGVLNREAYNSAIPVWMKVAGIGVTLVIVLILGKMANSAIARVTNGAAPAQPPVPPAA
ncbi:MAG: TVP38/TMEM64 family protein [Phycisphaeraceae bacterium]|nr:TVP38/TMEM64 family protein [Phycisphaeraceae bacterium]